MMIFYVFLYWCCVAWVTALFLNEGEYSYKVNRTENWARVLVAPVSFIIIALITTGSLIKSNLEYLRR